MEPPLLEIQHLIFNEAVRLGASDIHIEPGRRQTRVRYRIDGLLLRFKRVSEVLEGTLEPASLLGVSLSTLLT